MPKNESFLGTNKGWYLVPDVTLGEQIPTLREKRTEKVQSISGQQFAQTLFPTQGSMEVLYLFSVAFLLSLVGTIENMRRQSVLPPYSIFCNCSVLNTKFFPVYLSRSRRVPS